VPFLATDPFQLATVFTGGSMRASLVFVLAASLAVAQSQVAGAPQAAAVVRMKGGRFLPVRVSISAGQTVEWVNQSSEPHTITTDPAKAMSVDNVALPENAAPFNSGYIPAGHSFRQTFTVPGIYKYICTVHEGQGMVAVVEVRPK
jgi:plastocyanin